MKIQNADTIQSYYTRVSQIKEQLVVVEEEVENAEMMIATLNGLPRSWDSFMKKCVPEGSDYFQLTLGRRRSSTRKKRRRRWEQLKIKLSPFKEDPSSDKEYEELNS